MKGESWGTSNDNIVVLGAHWDTIKESPGYNDNGSGMAAVLEVARVLSSMDCKPKYSVILVGFDIEEYGMQGATAFVQDYLVPEILTKYQQEQFQGAYILDSLLNFNETAGSQFLSPPYRNVLTPDFFEAVKDEEFKGDFLAAVSRGADDSKLVKLLRRHWIDVQEGSSRKMRFIPMNLKDGLPGGRMFDGLFPMKQTLLDNSNFLRSDHASFWFANNIDFYGSFKAIHLTDTGSQRGIMRRCYHAPCDVGLLNYTVPYANYHFYETIVKAVLNTMTDASQSSCPQAERPIKIFTSDPEYYNEGEFTFYNQAYKRVLVGRDPFREPSEAALESQGAPRSTNIKITGEDSPVELKSFDPKSENPKIEGLSEPIPYKTSDLKSDVQKQYLLHTIYHVPLYTHYINPHLRMIVSPCYPKEWCEYYQTARIGYTVPGYYQKWYPYHLLL